MFRTTSINLIFKRRLKTVSINRWFVEMEERGRQLSQRRPLTTGIAGFAECCILCRVLFVGHSAKKSLPSAALGKVRLSAKSPFTEC
jgi:hypothetical protein